MKEWIVPLTLTIEADTKEEADMCLAAVMVEFDGYSFTFVEGQKVYPRLKRED